MQPGGGGGGGHPHLVTYPLQLPRHTNTNINYSLLDHFNILTLTLPLPYPTLTPPFLLSTHSTHCPTHYKTQHTNQHTTSPPPRSISAPRITLPRPACSMPRLTTARGNTVNNSFRSTGMSYTSRYALIRPTYLPIFNNSFRSTGTPRDTSRYALIRPTHLPIFNNYFLPRSTGCWRVKDLEAPPRGGIWGVGVASTGGKA